MVQVRRYACDTVNALPADPRLRQNDGRYKGRLNLAWAYGVVFTRMTRQQLKTLAGMMRMQWRGFSLQHRQSVRMK